MPDVKVCSVEGCGKPFLAKGWCSVHYYRWKRTGDPLLVRPRSLPKHARKFFETAKEYRGEGCLFWPYARTGAGYAKIGIGNETLQVHRLVCEEINGASPTPDHEAAHSCGHGHLGCIAGAHLRWATSIENAADKKKHGTHIQGEDIGGAKLTESDVREIRRLAGAVSGVDLALMFNVSTANISLVINRKHWRWLE